MNYLLTGKESERLKYRLLKADDFDSWMPLFEEEDVAKFLGMDSGLSPRELCEKWFEKSFSRYDDNLGGMNVLADKNTGELIGQSGILIQIVDGKERFEVGYSILPKFWNMGYASEASRTCLNHAFEHEISSSIISMVHVENINSERVALRNGMSLEKRIDSYHGMPVNIFCITKDEWLANKKA